MDPKLNNNILSLRLGFEDSIWLHEQAIQKYINMQRNVQFGENKAARNALNNLSQIAAQAHKNKEKAIDAFEHVARNNEPTDEDHKLAAKYMVGIDGEYEAIIGLINTATDYARGRDD